MQFTMSDSEEVYNQVFSAEESHSEEAVVLDLEAIEGLEDEIELVESEDDPDAAIDLEDYREEDELLLQAAESPEADPDFEEDVENEEDEDEESEASEACLDHESCILFAKECHDLLVLRGLAPKDKKKHCVAALTEAICDTYQ